ncbi:MAG: ABC transporter substrate-binding protein, partial [Actinomycetota bacterium]|nr:ABC transporter substrate-binding protein [Actinomycetota bacterium]
GTSGGSTGSTTGSTTGTTGASGATGGTTGGTTGGATGGTTGSATGSTLFTTSENRIGITPTTLRMCGHAALIYAKAFQTDVKDLNVFWDALNDEKGGIYGRKVEMSYVDDQYKPDVAVQAAKTCVAKDIFMLLGGIGFDQIPAVRNYVEQAHVLYLHHTATVQGSKGLKYSFTELPSVERLGSGFAQLAQQKYKGKRIGILKRDSTNWEPGIQAFKALGKIYGLNIVAEEKAAASAGSYAAQIQNLKNATAEVVFIWLNALESFEAAKQMHTARFNPNILAFPFNLTSQSLMSESVDPVMEGVAMYPAYSNGDYSGPFASYADDMKEFERQYAKYDGGAAGPDLSSVAGDLLFLNWVAQKALYKQLLLCGRDCTRNRFVDVLQGYHAIPTSSACPIDFRRGDGHHGADNVTFMQTYLAPDGKYNWRETRHCVAP